MDKLSFIKIAPAIALTMCSMVFTSCSDDDENDGSSTPEGPTTTFSDKLLTQVGHYMFNYDDKNRCDAVYYVNDYDGSTYPEAEIDYKSSSIYFNTEETNMKVNFNNQGYITKAYGSWEESGDGYVYKGSLSMSFDYDKSGHLTSITTKAEGEEKYDGEGYSYSSIGKAKFTWDNGNLINMTTEYNDIEDGEEYEFIDTYEISYNEGIENKTRQMPYILSASMFDYDASVLANIGMFGVGTKNLPETIVNSYIEDGESYGEDIERVSYELNSDGTIKREYHDYETIEYTYTALDDISSKAASRYAANLSTSKDNKAGHRLYKMFKHLQKRNKTFLQ